MCEGRIGSWIQLQPGAIKFYPFDPRPEEISIRAIAYGLAGINRFGGFTRYTVAQHCLEVSKLCSPENAFTGLLHDAAEGLGLGDCPTPIKHVVGMETFRWAEERIQDCIFERFGLPREIPEEVHRLDAILLATEARDFMSPLHPDWKFKESPLPEKLVALSPNDAEALFLARFMELARPEDRDALVGECQR